MTPEERALRDAFLSELWPTCPEWHPTRDEREAIEKRNASLNRPSTAGPPKAPDLSTGCAETGGQESPDEAEKCA